MIPTHLPKLKKKTVTNFSFLSFHLSFFHLPHAFFFFFFAFFSWTLLYLSVMSLSCFFKFLFYFYFVRKTIHIYFKKKKQRKELMMKRRRKRIKKLVVVCVRLSLIGNRQSGVASHVIKLQCIATMYSNRLLIDSVLLPCWLLRTTWEIN